MGLNAQTAVPVFTAGQVLTAEQVTQINTGIPVFATTTTRDAAFGGTGEKVLAQGQTCYIEATSTYQTYNGSAWVSLVTAPGLNLVKSQTIGNAVASVTVTDAFSATYDNYRIIISGGAGSATTSTYLALGATTTGYYSAVNGRTYANAAITSGNANGANWGVGEASANGINACIDIFSPFATDETIFTALQSLATTTGYTYQCGGYLANTTSYTAFTFAPNSGTLTGGTIRVYGYANS